MASPDNSALESVYENLKALQDQGDSVLFSTLRDYFYSNGRGHDHTASRIPIDNSTDSNAGTSTDARTVLYVPSRTRTLRSDRGTDVVVADLDSDGIMSTRFDFHLPFWTRATYPLYDVALFNKMLKVPENVRFLDETLRNRSENVHGRIVFMSTVSGVDSRERQSAQDRSVPPLERGPDHVRTPIALGINPPVNSLGVRVNMEILSTIAKHTVPDPDLLLQYLFDSTHLTQKVCLGKKRILDCGRAESSWKELHICIDAENRFFVALNQPGNDGPWTMLILATENNCMGLDLHMEALLTEQPLQAFRVNPTQTFRHLIGNLSTKDCAKIKIDPMFLMSLYSDPVISAFAAHIELYHRNWSQSYEPWARSSAVYGYAHHREAVRRLSRTYATHLRHLRHTIDRLQSNLPDYSSSVQEQLFVPLTRDFERFSEEIDLLKTDCDQFLEQQISKVALQETRSQMREARDIKHLTYFAFIFVPLSLASSFFGMNVKELDSGSTPVWRFAVVALGLLGLSLLGTWVAANPVWKGKEQQLNVGDTPVDQVPTLTGTHTVAYIPGMSVVRRNTIRRT